MVLMSLHHGVASLMDYQLYQENPHEGEKFPTTRRHPSSFFDGTCVAIVTGSEIGLCAVLSGLVSVPM